VRFYQEFHDRSKKYVGGLITNKKMLSSSFSAKNLIFFSYLIVIQNWDGDINCYRMYFYCDSCLALLFFNCEHQLGFKNDIKIHRWAKVKFFFYPNMKLRFFAHFLSTRFYKHKLNKH